MATEARDGTEASEPPPVAASAAPSTLSRRERVRANPLFETFQGRDFRFYWLATFAYFLVFGAQRFTFVWLVVDISGRAGLAGLTGFALGIPAFFVTLPAGVWADRLHRGRMVTSTNLAGAAVTFTVALLIWGDVMSVPLALGAALALGLATAMTQPPLTAIVPLIVPRERLMSAIVLRTMGQNLAQIFGAAIGGGAIAAWGFGGGFALQAGCYGLAALAMFAVRVPPLAQAPGERPPMRTQLLEGLRFVFGNPALRALMLIMAASGLFMLGPVFVLVPVIAEEKLGQEAFAAGLLFAATGSGMLLMSVVLASRRDLRGKGRLFLVNMVIGAPVLAMMGLAPWYWLLAASMFAWGLGGGIFVNMNQTLLQMNTPDRVMGRVMSISVLCIAGVLPLGSLLAGVAAEVVGADVYMVICGAVLLVVAVAAYARQPELRAME